MREHIVSILKRKHATFVPYVVHGHYLFKKEYLTMYCINGMKLNDIINLYIFY